MGMRFRMRCRCRCAHPAAGDAWLSHRSARSPSWCARGVHEADVPPVFAAHLDQSLLAWRRWRRRGLAGHGGPGDFGRSRTKAHQDIEARLPMARRAGMPTYTKKHEALPSLDCTRRGARGLLAGRFVVQVYGPGLGDTLVPHPATPVPVRRQGRAGSGRHAQPVSVPGMLDLHSRRHLRHLAPSRPRPGHCVRQPHKRTPIPRPSPRPAITGTRVRMSFGDTERRYGRSAT